MMIIQEEHVNGTEGYRLGEPAFYEAISENVGEVFSEARKEFGRCIGSVYVESPGPKPPRIGWVFEKIERYTDSGESYINETWITLHKELPDKRMTFHYINLDKAGGEDI